MTARTFDTFRRLRASTSGLALLEFAFGMPILLILGMTGAETANWITVKMRVSQLALHVADNAARMGEGGALTAKTISEATINDVLTGAGVQGGDLNIYTRGRVVLTDLEPAANPNTGGRYYIRWQRCRGSGAYNSPNTPTTTNPTTKVPASTVSGIGPTTAREVTAMDGNATMYAEVFYRYVPIISDAISPSTTFTEIASMSVRDRRDLSDDNENGATATHPNGIYKVTGVAPSTC